MASEKALSSKVSSAVSEALDLYGPLVDKLEVDVQDSGEYPYRVVVRDEQLPMIGLAKGEPLPDDTA